MASTLRGIRTDGCELPYDPLQVVFAETVVRVFTVSPAFYHSGLREHFHVMRQRRLRDVEFFQDLARAQFSTRQHVYDLQAFGL